MWSEAKHSSISSRKGAAITEGAGHNQVHCFSTNLCRMSNGENQELPYF